MEGFFVLVGIKMKTNNGDEGTFLTPGIKMMGVEGFPSGWHRIIYEQRFHHLLTPKLR
jgi:hypothetical protein